MTPAQLSTLISEHNRYNGAKSAEPQQGTVADLMMLANMKAG